MNLNKLKPIDSNLNECFNCKGAASILRIKLFYSLFCNHRLCEECFTKLFKSKTSVECAYCSRIHSSKDFSIKSKNDIFCENDQKYRKMVLSL